MKLTRVDSDGVPCILQGFHYMCDLDLYYSKPNVEFEYYDGTVHEMRLPVDMIECFGEGLSFEEAIEKIALMEWEGLTLCARRKLDITEQEEMFPLEPWESGITKYVDRRGEQLDWIDK